MGYELETVTGGASSTVDGLSVSRKQFLSALYSAIPPVGAVSSEPLVSVIILNHNGAAVLARCLRHLEAQSYLNFEIIVVDNGSTDQSLLLAEQVPVSRPLHIVAHDENRGVAGGRNSGLSYARGDIMAFIDNDGYADVDWLRNGVARIVSASDIGAVAPCVFFADRPDLLNGVGGQLSHTGHAADIGYGLPITGLKPVYEVLYPMGCGMLLRRSALELGAPLDETLPKWFDDTELGIRIWEHGLRVVVEPTAIIDHDAHHGDVARTPAAWRRALLFEKARIRLVWKYFPLAQLGRWSITELFHCIRRIISGRLAECAVVLMALGWNLLHVKSALAIRRQSVVTGQWFACNQQLPLPPGQSVHRRGA